ncbi:hypothetical protein CBS101457_005040 [Exobasidium rhododendri]|nr:hypothetical protein CBS101457_005040 [Exobasidium rhododendri]
MIALGSLWQSSVQDVEKGAEMWRFVLGTNWCNGWRMVDSNEATAYTMSLLYTGHSYTMMTNSRQIHQIGRAAWSYAHSFAIDPAWQIGSLISSSPFHSFQELTWDALQSKTKSQLLTTWHNWHRDEEKLRVALSLAILDAQQRRFFPRQSSFQTLILRSPECASESAFQASTVSEWKDSIRKATIPRRALGDLMRRLFTPYRPDVDQEDEERDHGAFIGQLSMSALLEGISNAGQLESQNEGQVSGLWEGSQQDEELVTKREIEMNKRTLHALANWATWWLNGSLPIAIDRTLTSLPQDTLGLEMRWHAIHMEMFARNIDVLEPLTELCRTRSSFPKYRITSDITLTKCFRGDLKQWLSTPLGRRAMVHAGRLIACFVQTTSHLKSLAIGVAQGVFDAVVLLTCLVIEESATQNDGVGEARDSRHTRHTSIELVPPYRRSCRHWTQLGYAGLAEQIGSQDPLSTSAITQDWVQDQASSTVHHPHGTECPDARTSDCEAMRSTRHWIQHGQMEDARIMGTSARQALPTMQKVVKLVHAADLKWCYARDCTDILEQALQHAKEQRDF